MTEIYLEEGKICYLLSSSKISDLVSLWTMMLYQ